MTKESFKKFVKDNKDLIIGVTTLAAGAAALVVLGVELRKPSLVKTTDSVDPYFLDMLHTVDKASKGCTHYVRLTPSEIADAIARGGDVLNCVRDPDGSLLDVKSLIVFGNKVEP